MYSVFAVGITLWLADCLALEDRPIVAGNAVTLVLLGTILVMKLHYQND